MRLMLWFQSSPRPELVRVEFVRRQGKSRTAVRRKSISIEPHIGSFQWTSAVKAFATLAVGTCAKEGFLLSGEASSPAASLDYAVSKPTSWIVDIFGREESGKPSAQSAFRRENSERKLPGPVRISFAASLKEAGAISIYLDNRKLDATADLAALLQTLESDKVLPPAAAKSWYEQEWFQSEFYSEVELSLQETDILEPLFLERIEKPAAEMAQDIADLKRLVPPLGKRYGRPDRKSMELLQSLSEPLSIALPPMAVGACVLFRHLKANGIPLELDSAFPTTTAIIEEAAESEASSFHGVVLSWGAAGKRHRMRHGNKFVSSMLLPRTSVHLICSSAGSKPFEEVYLGSDPYGYPWRYFDALRTQGDLVASDASPHDASFAEILSAFPDRARAAILTFPLSVVAVRQHELEFASRNEPRSRIGDNILCLHESIDQEIGEALLSALRIAWFELAESPSARKTLIQALLADADYGEYLTRLGGLYRAQL